MFTIYKAVFVELWRDRHETNWLFIVYLFCKRLMSLQAVVVTSELLNNVAVFCIFGVGKLIDEV